jgi:DNA-binding NtrC family response regulator
VPPRSPNTTDDACDDSTATVVRKPVVPRPLAAVIRVLNAKAQPSELRLSTGQCIVGSGSACQIVIADPTVSRAHVELDLVREGVAVRDLGSRNGTFYLGQRVERMIVGLGARITVGASVTLTIDADDDALSEGLAFDGDEYRGILGTTPAMRRLFAKLSRLENSLATVLVEGESGVGKELVAQALHDGSAVRENPFISVNCGAIPRDLVASELFGHKRGAFTGALEARKGAFESADGGTLFLDEIGELPVEIQPTLLRVLEKGEVRSLGSDQNRHVKVRVIAATNRDLEQEVRAGRFREDLFYRLAVVRLHVPTLSQRIDDIEPLARHFAASIGLSDIGSDVLEKLMARTWPGNVRELRNAVQAYAALGVLPEPTRSKAATLELGLSEHVDLMRPYGDQKEELADRFTRVYLRALLERAGGNQTVAARIAGLDRTHLGRLLAKHGIGKA